MVTYDLFNNPWRKVSSKTRVTSWMMRSVLGSPSWMWLVAWVGNHCSEQIHRHKSSAKPSASPSNNVLFSAKARDIVERNYSQYTERVHDRYANVFAPLLGPPCNLDDWLLWCIVPSVALGSISGGRERPLTGTDFWAVDAPDQARGERRLPA